MKRGKILKVKYGYNPNSSSLGISVLMMMMGSVLGYVAVSLTSSIVRIRKRLEPEKADRQEKG